MYDTFEKVQWVVFICRLYFVLFNSKLVALLLSEILSMHEIDPFSCEKK